jgi:RNA polymerase sigma-70 factor (ECF subfamily)
MTANEDRDEWLMAQVKVGRRDSLERLVRRHATPLLTFMHRMTGDPHRSEDLVQDTFLGVWKKRHQYEFPRLFRPWLYAIAMNRCRASFRVKSPAVVPLDLDAVPTARAMEASPVEAAINSETAVMVASAITQLAPLQRAVVVLRIWDGLSYAEIGEVLDRTETNVRVTMHHGLNALRKYLEPRLK